MTPFPRTFASNVNGARFDVEDQLTASLLMKSEKKEFVRVEHHAQKAESKKNKKADTDLEQDIH